MIFNDIVNSNFSPCKCIIYIGVGPTLNVKVKDITIELDSDFSVQSNNPFILLELYATKEFS